MKILFIIIAFLFILMPVASSADLIIGGETEYVVKKGDTLELIGAKLGVNWKRLVRDNDIDEKKILRIGQKLKANTRKIVPVTVENGIVVNIPDRMLYFFKESKLATAFPVGLGMSLKDDRTVWRTPTGKLRITAKEKNPTWYVPESIQEEMKAEGKPVLTIVLPGPDNPLGKYALKTSIQGILIHETIWPNSVYQFRSHGCIRVLPEHMKEFFNEIELNTGGEIIYKPVKIAVSDEEGYLLKFIETFTKS
jgi:L,D-transpeptidase ErfK/SrfK